MLQDLNAQEKDTVTFEVTVNNENVTYKWLKNGVEIRSTDRCQARCKQLTHTLSIRNVHGGDSAAYSFSAGSAITTAKLHVEGNISLPFCFGLHQHPFIWSATCCLLGLAFTHGRYIRRRIRTECIHIKGMALACGCANMNNMRK